jgi:hypothetical protein
MLLGSIMLAVSSMFYVIFPSTIGYEGDNLCRIRLWLFPTSLSLLMGPILVKIFRIHTAWNWGWKLNALPDIKLLGLVVLVFIPPLLIVGINESLESTRSYVFLDFDATLPKNMYTLSCTPRISTVIGPLIVYFFALCILGFYLSFKCRKAPQGFNEANSLLEACLFIFLHGCLIIPLQFLGLNPTALTVLRI